MKYFILLQRRLFTNVLGKPVSRLHIFSNSSYLRNRLSRQYAINAKAIKKIEPFGYFMLIIPAAAFCLGTWQVQRKKWKLGLIKKLENKIQAPSIELPYDIPKLHGMEYQKVKLRGTFDYSRELYIGPRSLIVAGDVKSSGSGILSSNKSGYNVVNPFQLADRNLFILVNRGWIPRERKNPSKQLEGQIEGEVEIHGVVRCTENRAPFMPKNIKDTNYFYRDIPKMAAKLGTEEIFVDAIETFPDGPVGGQTRVTLRDEHLSYIFTWYLLCLATSYMWYYKFLRRLPLL